MTQAIRMAAHSLVYIHKINKANRSLYVASFTHLLPRNNLSTLDLAVPLTTKSQEIIFNNLNAEYIKLQFNKYKGDHILEWLEQLFPN